MGRTFEVQPCFFFLEDGCRLTEGEWISQVLHFNTANVMHTFTTKSALSSYVGICIILTIVRGKSG